MIRQFYFYDTWMLQIEWECHEGFSLVEPGVYLLQISGTLTNATAAVKLVSDDLEAELVSLVAPASPHYKARSTIFTVEDDDRDAEKIVVEIQDKVSVISIPKFQHKVSVIIKIFASLRTRLRNYFNLR